MFICSVKEGEGLWQIVSPSSFLNGHGGAPERIGKRLDQLMCAQVWEAQWQHQANEYGK